VVSPGGRDAQHGCGSEAVAEPGGRLAVSGRRTARPRVAGAALTPPVKGRLRTHRRVLSAAAMRRLAPVLAHSVGSIALRAGLAALTAVSSAFVCQRTV